jgi:hypothetical protein
MLDPQRAVLIERGDARLGHHELEAGAVGGVTYEGDDRLLRCAVIPGRERIGSPGQRGR